MTRHVNSTLYKKILSLAAYSHMCPLRQATTAPSLGRDSLADAAAALTSLLVLSFLLAAPPPPSPSFHLHRDAVYHHHSRAAARSAAPERSHLVPDAELLLPCLLFPVISVFSSSLFLLFTHISLYLSCSLLQRPPWTPEVLRSESPTHTPASLPTSSPRKTTMPAAGASSRPRSM
ncbi:hypothetical protein VPH35_104287 [Triticum aestivum]